MDKDVWFVTGAATGFGRAIVEHAAANGACVVATARDSKRLADLAGENVLTLDLDVTCAEQVKAAAQEAERAFGRVDVVVNNAGYNVIAAIEEAEDDEIRTLFDTHVFGPIAIIRTFLPGMRARRRGHFFNFSSYAGITGSPGTGYYAACKHAIGGMSEALSKELAPLGIKVTIVEPGPFETNFFTTSRRYGRTRIADYDSTSGAYRDRAATMREMPGDPARAAKILFDLALTETPPVHLPLGRFASLQAEKILADRIAEVERWRETSLDADFPQWRDRPWP